MGVGLPMGERVDEAVPVPRGLSRRGPMGLGRFARGVLGQECPLGISFPASSMSAIGCSNTGWGPV